MWIRALNRLMVVMMVVVVMMIMVIMVIMIIMMITIMLKFVISCIYLALFFLDFEKLVKKVNSRTLDEMQLSVERIKACDSILVSSLSAQITKDTIMLYFENVRRSGGGDVKDVVLHKDTNSAVVYFEDGRGN